MNKATILGTLAAAAIVGVLVGTTGSRSTASEVRPENAAGTLQTPLSADQRLELVHGLQLFQFNDYAAAAPILSKYALLGEPFSQMDVGLMHYFGKGLPLDREEGMRWLRMAGAQNSVAQGMLSVVESGNLPSIDGRDQPAETYSYYPSGGAAAVDSAPDHSTIGSAPESQGTAIPPVAYSSPQSGASSADDAFHLRVEQELREPSPSFTRPDQIAEPAPNVGAINVGTGQFMAPAGPGAYVNPRDGTYYAPSGPDGVVDTRTGEYSPVSH